MAIGYVPYLDPLESGSPNTSINHHAKRTYALVESNFPFQIRIEETEKSIDIKSVGEDRFGGDLKHNVSAHPKVNQ